MCLRVGLHAEGHAAGSGPMVHVVSLCGALQVARRAMAGVLLNCSSSRMAPEVGCAEHEREARELQGITEGGVVSYRQMVERTRDDRAG